MFILIKLFIQAIAKFILGVVLDQYTKILAVKHLKDAPIPIIDGVFELHYLENRGAAFGILQNQQTFFLIAGIIILGVATFAFIKLPEEKRLIPLRICIVLICSGAIGNMIDRIIHYLIIQSFFI